ncbi:hypothetical protein ACTMTJ_13930 [Phytohabitans sp. LJ34]|uniref:hypothetical protein n=1 Tax=Phytohabitans sp. LJ34 TaxID=3452217 RepID=UPI003F8A6020
MAEARFRFAASRAVWWLLAPFGVRPGNAWLALSEAELVVRFGPWRLRTARDNVLDARRSGPYRWWRVIGPHLSLADRGVTFGTNAAAGVCVRFATPVPALLPGRWLRHPGLTVTVADPDGLVDALRRRSP